MMQPEVPSHSHNLLQNAKNAKAQKEIQKEFKKKIRSQQFGTLREDLNPSSVRGQG